MDADELETDNCRIARQGCTVVVPFREEMTKRHLKVTGDLGRIVFMVYLPIRLSFYHLSEESATTFGYSGIRPLQHGIHRG